MKDIEELNGSKYKVASGRVFWLVDGRWITSAMNCEEYQRQLEMRDRDNENRRLAVRRDNKRRLLASRAA